MYNNKDIIEYNSNKQNYIEKTLRDIFSKLSNDEHIKLMTHKFFIKIISKITQLDENPKNSYIIQNVCYDYLGDWFESVESVNFEGAIVFYQDNMYTHEIIDYISKENIIRLSENGWEKK